MSVEQTKTIRQTVFDDAEVTGTKQRLILLSDQLFLCKEERGKAEVAVKFDKCIEAAKAGLTEIENEVAYEVKNDLDENRKAKFPNDKLRKEAIARRLGVSKEYADALNDIQGAASHSRQLHMNLIEAKAALFSREAQFQAQLAIAAMIAGLAHESTTNTTHRHTMTMKIGEN